MPDIPEQEPGEPIVSPKQPGWLTRPAQKHQWLGMVALGQGLALLALFWLAPWFSWRVPVNIPLGIPVTPALEDYFHFLAADHSYSGWAMAQGISVVNTAFVPLVPLWLIPLVALALLVLAALHLRHIISNRWMSAALLVFSTLALLVQLSFFIQARTIQAPHFDALLLMGVSWGFWGTTGVNAAVLVSGAMLFRSTRQRGGTQAAEAG